MFTPMFLSLNNILVGISGNLQDSRCYRRVGELAMSELYREIDPTAWSGPAICEAASRKPLNFLCLPTPLHTTAQWHQLLAYLSTDS